MSDVIAGHQLLQQESQISLTEAFGGEFFLNKCHPCMTTMGHQQLDRGNQDLLSINNNLLSFADRIYNRYRDLYNEKTLFGRKGKVMFYAVATIGQRSRNY